MPVIAGPVLPLVPSTYVRELAGLFAPAAAATFPAPELLVLNESLAAELGADPAALRSREGVALLVGAELPDGLATVAQGYAGHQFGGWSPRLGDGRALLLGELLDTRGKRRDVHLKGSGRTRFARGGDGKAAVGPMLREHLIGEAMHALGIPTTRALAVVATGEAVRRETLLPGAVLTRVAASHLRVGTFQYATATLGDLELLQRLTDHAIARHHPQAAAAERPGLALLDAVVAAQAELIARWMLVGFVHGVMNTDNMTISGETIDYGPCAFLDAYDAATVFSSIDHGGRYAYGSQPDAAQWNLARLAEALLPLIDPEDQDAAIPVAMAVLDTFPERFGRAWRRGMQAKLGLAAQPAVEVSVFDDLLELLRAHEADWTASFRALAAELRGEPGELRALVAEPDAFAVWLARWRALAPDPDAMDRVNPRFIPRNHLVEAALTQATLGDLGPFEELLDVLQHPFEEQPGREAFAQPGPRKPYVTYCGT